MAKFRKKPVVIEACKVSDEEWPDWLVEARPIVTIDTNDGIHLDIVTLEGVMRANEGDWIIRGVKGELYPCREDIFKMTYEPVDEGEEGDAAAQAETKGGETMNEEMMAHTFVAESMTVETGRIIPSPALAEAVIGGIAQIIAERDALKAQWASVPWEALRNVLIDYYDSGDENMVTVSVWRFENAPCLTDEQAAALVDLVRKA